MKLVKIKSTNNITFILFNVFIPLFLGGLVYLFFRSERLIMFEWLKSLGIKNGFDLLRENFVSINTYLPSWFIFSLPDALWVYSFTSAIILIWNNERKVAVTLLLIPLILGPGVELLQLLNLFKGTFDVIDLTLTICAFLLSIILNLKTNQYENQVY